MSLTRKKNLLLLFVFIGSLFIWLSLISFFSFIAQNNLRQGRFDLANKQAKVARILLKPIAQVSITTKKFAFFKAWDSTLELIILTPDLNNSFNQMKTAFTNQQGALITPEQIALLEKTDQIYQQLLIAVSQSRLLQWQIPQNTLKQLREAGLILTDLPAFLKIITQKDQRITTLLQNSDEIRATGGFIGSVASLELKRNQLQPTTFYDVYDLAGQIQSLVPAPTPVRNYLTTGKEMNLQDANWHPDFTQSAPVILELLQQTELKDTTVLIGVNLKLVEAILAITGPLELTDSQTVVTAANFSQLARQERKNFFAGDKQKKQFLQEVYTILKIKLVETNLQKQLQLLNLIGENLDSRDVVLYSPTAELQTLIEDHRWGGAITPTTDNFLYLLESNVGINKANQGIERNISLSWQADQIELKLEFINHNQPLSSAEVQQIKANPALLQAPHLGYVNYQRLISNLKLEPINLSCNGENNKILEKNIIQVDQAQAHQLAWLILVPEQNAVVCELTLKPEKTLRSNATWTILKQPGLPPSQYIFNYFGRQLNKSLAADFIIEPN